MAAGEEKLRLVLSAVDKTTAPLRALTRRIESIQRPVKNLRKSFADLSKAAGLPKLGERIAWIGRQAAKLATGVVAAGAGILAFVERTADGLDNLSEFTRLIGVNVEHFQEYRWAAKRAGIENETFSAGMKSFAKNVGAAQAGTGRLAGLLKKVAPSVLRQIKGARDTGEALEIVLAAMRRLPDAMKRNEFANKAFGNSQLALLATLSPDELRRFRDEARGLSMVMSTEAAAAAERLMDNIDALKASAMGLAQSIAVALFPDMQSATDQLLAWIKANREWIVSGGKEAVLEFARGMKEIGVFLVENVPKMQQFVSDVGGLKTALALIAAISLAPLLQTIVAIGIALGPVGVVAATLVAAVAYVASNLKSVRSGMQTIMGVFSNPLAPAAPRPPAANAAQAAVGASKLDAAMKVNIELDDKRARISKILSSGPSIQFGGLARGVALEAN